MNDTSTPVAPVPASPNANPVVQRAAPKSTASSPLISNPVPPKEVEPEKPPESLPSTTIAEMAAGRAALEKNKPVAEALEEANRQRDAASKV